MGTRRILDAQLQEMRESLERAEVIVEGISSGSPEGEVWMFSFIRTWPLPPNRAEARVHLSWIEWPDSEKLTVTRTSEVYRESQPSQLKESVNETYTVKDALDMGIHRIVVKEFLLAQESLAAITNSKLNPLAFSTQV